MSNTYLYSKSMRGMFIESVHGKNIPADAVAITDAQYKALMDGQSEGHEIVPDENGHPTLRAPSVNRALAAQRADLQSQIETLERKGLRAQREFTLDSRNAEAKSRLNAINEQIGALRKELDAEESPS